MLKLIKFGAIVQNDELHKIHDYFLGLVIPFKKFQNWPVWTQQSYIHAILQCYCLACLHTCHASISLRSKNPVSRFSNPRAQYQTISNPPRRATNTRARMIPRKGFPSRGFRFLYSHFPICVLSIFIWHQETLKISKSKHWVDFEGRSVHQSHQWPRVAPLNVRIFYICNWKAYTTRWFSNFH